MALHALFGRSRERMDLEGALEAAVAGRGSVFFLSGEAGIGKTRLAEELARIAHDRAARVLWGRAWEVEGAPPCWPWIQVLRGCRAWESLGADLERLQSTQEIEPLRAGTAMVELLERLTRETPLVLVFDDLHACDVASLELLQVVARDLRQLRVLVLGTYRELEARRVPKVSALLAKIAREGTARPLGRLDRAAVGQWLASTLGPEPSKALTSAVFETTEGNPLFVDALAPFIASHGRGASLPEGFTLPDSIRETVREMLLRLSPAARSVLDAASVFGRECSQATLQLVSGEAAPDVLTAIHEGTAAGILSAQPLPSSPVRFAHVLIREVLYQELSPASRMELHAHAGEALARVHAADPDEYVAELAHHKFEGAALGSWLEAADFSAKAGHQAMRLFAFDAAARHLERALTALDHAESRDDAQRADLLWRLGASRIRIGQAQSGKETCERAAALAERTGAHETYARAALAYGLESNLGRVEPRLVELLEAALHLAGENDSLRAQIMARLAAAMTPTPYRERPTALAREAMVTARTLGDRRVLAEVLTNARAAFGPPDDLEELIALDREIAALAAATGDKALEFAAHHRLSLAAIQRGDRELLRAELVITQQLAAETRVPQHQVRAAGARLLQATLADDTAAIARIEQEVRELCERFDDPSRLAAMEVNRYARAEANGDPLGEAAAFDALQTLCAQHPSLGAWPITKCWTLFRCPPSRLDPHRRDEARTLMLQLAPELRDGELGSRSSLGPLLTLMAPLCLQLDARTELQKLYDFLLPYADRSTVFPELLVCLGPVAHDLGRLALALGHREKALLHFRDALAVCKAAGFAGYEARARRALDALEQALVRPGGASERALSRLGTIVKRHRIQRILGMGGMATVYAATDPEGRHVAIKFIHESLHDDPEYLRLFHREASLANQVGHPGAVPVLAHDIDDEGHPFLIMPLLEGETLRARWERAGKHLPVAEVAVIMADVLDVLIRAHENGIVHRDIKPENLFITRHGDVRVLDFGIARRTEADGSGTLTGRMIGTPAFMPPEQALGNREAIGPASDCWAAGATIFALLAGEVVHPADNASAQLAAAATKHARSLAVAAPSLPPSICQFVDRSLAFEPKDRWPSTGDMRTASIEAFESALGEPIAAVARRVRAALAAELSRDNEATRV